MQTYYFSIIAKIRFGILGILTLNLISCKEVFEEDITENSVDLIIPTDGDTSYSNNVHFKWNELEGASEYNLQIVQPSFSNINTFLLDSNIVGEEFFYVLSPGWYEFQIRGENSAYQSIYTGPYSLYVDSVSELTNQVVPLLSPDDLIYSNASNFTFSWQSIYAAESYEFEIRSGSDFASSGTTLHNASSIVATSYSPPSGLFDSEGAYSWGVKAHNQNSSSEFSDRTIYIDLTLPNDPLATSPNHGDSFTDTVVFKWNPSVDSPVWAHVEIGLDTNFASILNEYDTNADSLQLVFPTADTYWWRLYLYDEAGNISNFYSEHRKVLIP